MSHIYASWSATTFCLEENYQRMVIQWLHTQEPSFNLISTLDCIRRITLIVTGLKCRIPRIRTHAFRLIDCSTHREGMWDSRLSSTIIRKAMAIEEGVDSVDGFTTMNLIYMNHRWLELWMLDCDHWAMRPSSQCVISISIDTMASYEDKMLRDTRSLSQSP